MGVVFDAIEERTRRKYWLPQVKTEIQDNYNPVVIQAGKMRLTNSQNNQWIRDLECRLHEQFELFFLCFVCGAPDAHFLLNNEIVK